MAIVRMKKLVLIGLNSEKKKILKTLHKLNCVEISSQTEVENTRDFNDPVLIDRLSTKLSKISFTFSFIKDIRLQALKLSEKYKKLAESEPEVSDGNDTVAALIEYKPPKKPLSFGLPGVSYQDFDNITAKEDELTEIINKIDQYNFKLIDIKSDMLRQNSLKEHLVPYLDIDAKFTAFSDTKNAAIMLGVIPSNKTADVEALQEEFSEGEIRIFKAPKFSAVVVVASLDVKDAIMAKLLEADYIPNNFRFDLTAREKYDECQDIIDELEKTRENIISEIVAYDKYIRDLEILYDYYLLELKKAEADNNFRFTENTFTMQGWFPVETEETLVAVLNRDFTVYIETKEPEEEETVPTLTRNSALVSPYETITNLYSVPSYREIDPNPYMAFFYFILFGIMVSDAAYGLILAIGGFLLYSYVKPRKGEAKLLLVIAMGGISTFIWGALFGGWFAISGIKPILFNPMEDSISMLALSFGIGIFHIVFAMGINAVALFKQKRYLDAICNVFGWWAVFLGIGFVVIAKLPNLAFFSTAGTVTILIGVLGVIVGGGIGKKGIGRKLLGGFANIYNITSYLSDILSYSRLFGLGLATGVVGMVINQIALVAIDMIPLGLGYIFAIPILVIGHAFNLGINTLGAYVHNSRLQYIEFFSKFYTGSGHQFLPFGTKTKYVYIEN